MPESDKKAAPPAETFSLEALAKMFDQVCKPAPHGDKFKSDHSCAAAMHGWNAHEYHNGPLSLTIADYVEALKASRVGKVHSPVCFRKARKA